jgi:hypothetical protein
MRRAPSVVQPLAITNKNIVELSNALGTKTTPFLALYIRQASFRPDVPI